MVAERVDQVRLWLQLEPAVGSDARKDDSEDAVEPGEMSEPDVAGAAAAVSGEELVLYYPGCSQGYRSPVALGYVETVDNGQETAVVVVAAADIVADDI